MGRACGSTKSKLTQNKIHKEGEPETDTLEVATSLGKYESVTVPAGSDNGTGGGITFQCGTSSYHMTGSAISELSGDVNQISKVRVESFQTNELGENVIDEIAEEPGVQHVLRNEIAGVGTYETGLRSTVTLKGEAMEVYAPENQII